MDAGRTTSAGHKARPQRTQTEGGDSGALAGQGLLGLEGNAPVWLPTK